MIYCNTKNEKISLYFEIFSLYILETRLFGAQKRK